MTATLPACVQQGPLKVPAARSDAMRVQVLFPVALQHCHVMLVADSFSTTGWQDCWGIQAEVL